jgi:hypothetical protein
MLSILNVFPVESLILATLLISMTLYIFLSSGVNQGFDTISLDAIGLLTWETLLNSIIRLMTKYLKLIVNDASIFY